MSELWSKLFPYNEFSETVRIKGEYSRADMIEPAHD